MGGRLPEMGNGCLGKKRSGGWEYRAHGLEVLTQKEPPMRDERGCKFFCVFGDRILMIKIRYVVLFVKLFDKNAVEYVF